ncbi:cation-translocating P-type ATPase [Thioclava sp. FR2]|uniref:cation-translocating P-type ATPase n=1 Tax=Thioclava sp. FR2 TaxID=3445780 RepID=UPI003EB76BB0
MADDSGLSGLSSAEAERRLAANGANELPAENRRTATGILLDVIKEPMLALLLGGGLIYGLIGELRDAAVLMAFACLSVLITVIQELRSEKVLAALKDLSSPRALVIRDGQRQRIAGRDVVLGDVIVLSEGDRVPADARLSMAQDLRIDESILTGEAVAVSKSATPLDVEVDYSPPGGDQLPFVYSGTLVVRGKGLATVTATATDTEIGRIGSSLAGLATETPRLYAQTRQIVVLFMIVGLAVSLLVGGLYYYILNDWLDAILASIAISMSMLPEEFPVVLAIFMAMGAWRLSKARVLTRRAAAIETLGAATVLCTDKTGTLTENRMAIRQVRLPGGTIYNTAGSTEPDDEIRKVLRAGVFACDPEPSDPMERAFFESWPQLIAREEMALVHSYGLRPELLAMTQVWRLSRDPKQLFLAAKGAPEAIADLCGLPEEARRSMAKSVDQMAADGLRVLGIAAGTAAGELPEEQKDLSVTFLGLIGLADPLRGSVPKAVAECRQAGIAVKMITGDYPLTALAIAREAGLAGNAPISGQELNALDDASLRKRLLECDVFARIMPEQKLRIVNALKSENHVVAMTGDGVNDAPSLKSAHIGIAMGGRGTDVAREASAIVLLDDDFGSILQAIKLGRRIYDNLQKAVSFIFAVHVPIAGLAIMPLLFGFPIILGPIHIAFLELVIDPVCTLVFEAEDEEDDIMKRPPRDPDERLFSGQLLGWSLTQGIASFITVAAVLFYGAHIGMTEDVLRGLTFISLIAVIVALIFVNRSFKASLWTAIRRPKPALLIVLTAVAILLVLILTWPAAQDIFRFGPLPTEWLGVPLGSGLVLLLALEILKPLWQNKRKS